MATEEHHLYCWGTGMATQYLQDIYKLCEYKPWTLDPRDRCSVHKLCAPVAERRTKQAGQGRAG